RATVHASGGHFSNVAVTFYDGDPKQGGTYIGHEVLPLLWAGGTATAAVDWDTAGLGGTRQVYAKVLLSPTQERRPDNNTAQLARPLGQVATPTPVVPEWPPAWLFASGLLALGWLADRRRRPG